MKKISAIGTGGFIENHLVSHLKKDRHYVKAIDLKYPEFSESLTDDFIIGDLKDIKICEKHITPIDEVYQLAADMRRASGNSLVKKTIGWEPKIPLSEGIKKHMIGYFPSCCAYLLK